jgi:hypothetical protein
MGVVADGAYSSGTCEGAAGIRERAAKRQNGMKTRRERMAGPLYLWKCGLLLLLQNGVNWSDHPTELSMRTYAFGNLHFHARLKGWFRG